MSYRLSAQIILAVALLTVIGRYLNDATSILWFAVSFQSMAVSATFYSVCVLGAINAIVLVKRNSRVSSLEIVRALIAAWVSAMFVFDLGLDKGFGDGGFRILMTIGVVAVVLVILEATGRKTLHPGDFDA